MFNKLITLLLPYMPKKLVWIFSRKYIAGETIDDAVRVSKELNAQGIMITIDDIYPSKKERHLIDHKSGKQP